MMDVASHLDAVRIAAAEVEALAALAVRAFDDADWRGADPLHVERMASVLGVIARSASVAVAAVNQLHGAVADAQPATSGEQWDHDDHVTSSGEQLQLVGAPSFDERQPKELLLPYTIANCLVRHESSVLSRLRRRLAETFEQPVDHRFFEDRYLSGEDANAALLRIFKRQQWMVGLTDEQTIESMASRR